MRKPLRYSALTLAMAAWAAFMGFQSGSFSLGLRLSMCMANIGDDSCFTPDNIDQQLKDSSLFVGMVVCGALAGLYPAYKLVNAYLPAEPAKKASYLQQGLHKINQFEVKEHSVGRHAFKASMALITALGGVSFGWGLGVTSETSWCETFVKFCYETDNQYKPLLMKSWLFLSPQIFLGLNGLLAGYKIGEYALDSASAAVNHTNPNHHPHGTSTFLRYSALTLAMAAWAAFMGFQSGSFSLGLRLSMCMANIGDDSCFTPDNIDQQLKDSSLFVGMVVCGALAGLYPAYKLVNAYLPAEPAKKASYLQQGLHKINQFEVKEHSVGRHAFKASMALITALAGVGFGWGLGVTSETSWCETFVKFCYETDNQYKPLLMKSWLFLSPQIFLGLSGLLAGFKIGEHVLDSASAAVNRFNPSPAAALLLGSDGAAARDPTTPTAAGLMV
ncbi:MAG: hypothetical protein P1U34_11725 [Coxiellaceae bacterium]|nr:hypothetical protein [Coxiellaceae bacterium]